MRHILVIDDDPGIQELLRDMLEHDGFQVSVAGNVASARHILDQGGVVLIVSDDVLRQDKGLTIAEEASARNTPRIVMTGNLERQETFREAGFDFMAKPFRLAELRRRVDAAIGTELT